jgi:hypothetical protein
MNAEIAVAGDTLKKTIPVFSLRVLEQVLYALIHPQVRYADHASLADRSLQSEAIR